MTSSVATAALDVFCAFALRSPKRWRIIRSSPRADSSFVPAFPRIVDKRTDSEAGATSGSEHSAGIASRETVPSRLYWERMAQRPGPRGRRVIHASRDQGRQALVRTAVLLAFAGAMACSAKGTGANSSQTTVDSGTSTRASGGSENAGSGGVSVGMGGAFGGSGGTGGGASGSDGGGTTSNGGSSSGGSSADAATLSGAPLALSDGFETAAPGGPPDPSLWTVASVDCSGAGKLAIDGTVAHRGSHSVRVDGGGGYCDHVFLGNASAVAAIGKQLYARFFVQLGTALGQGHTTFAAMKDDDDGGKDVRMGGQEGILMYNRESDDATLPTLSPAGIAMSLSPMTSPTWTCIEIHIDESAGTIDTWVNDHEVAGLVENGTATPDGSSEWLRVANWKPSLSNFRLGWESYAGQTMTLWFDDVAISSGRIGCGE